VKKKETMDALPKVIAHSIYNFLKPSQLVRIAQGVNFLAGVKRSWFRRSVYMSNRNAATFDFIVQSSEFGATRRGYFRVSLAFDQNFLKADLKDDYRQPTLMEIRVKHRRTKVFHYYELRSMTAPFQGLTRTQIMLLVAHDILEYYDFCKGLYSVFEGYLFIEPHGELVLQCPERSFCASETQIVDLLMNHRF
jgi:hypothetical protein